VSFVAPDWYIQAVSGGIGPLGVWKGFSELYHLGLIDKMPKLGIVQAAGCAPMVQAYAAGHAQAAPVVPKTLITVLATGDPGFSYVLLREAVASNGGAMVAIEDGDTFAAMRKVASKAGLSVEPATAVAFAGLEKMLGDGTIAPGETVVVNCSGHTFPAESHVLGDQYVLNLKIDASGAPTLSSKREHDGLGAALEHLDEQVTTILVVDDTLNDRRLIRRLLQRYKSYRVYEAHSGVEALRMVRERRPDMIVADLTMPEMDGFTLLESLKADPETANIPVVIVSAKTLTEPEREMLAANSESVWTKGGFETRALVDHVVRALGDEPLKDSKPSLSSSDRAKLNAMIEARQRDVRDDEALKRLPKVVIIEDNLADARLARRYVETSGDYSVIHAETGRDGLKAVYEHHPDLILLDLLLPDLDGFTVLEALKSNHDVADIPVVVLTARDLTAEETVLLHGRIHAILTKSLLDRQHISDIMKAVLR
jgi:CheY-like chemotaxis protein